jgi:hypothetical protein
MRATATYLAIAVTYSGRFSSQLYLTDIYFIAWAHDIPTKSQLFLVAQSNL